MRASELDAEPGSAEALERFTVERLSGRAVARQRANAGFDAARPLCRCHTSAFGHPLKRGVQQRRIASPRSRFGQLRHDQGPEPEIIALECLPGGVTCRLVSTEAVAEHGPEVCQAADEPTHPASAPVTSCGLEQLCRLRFLTA